MNKLERIIARAQRDADRECRPMAVLNLIQPALCRS